MEFIFIILVLSTLSSALEIIATYILKKIRKEILVIKYARLMNSR